MKKVVVSLVSALALATVTAGMAATTKSTVAYSDTFFNNSAAGVYVGGDLGYTRMDTKNVPGSDRGSFAWDANLGYQINPYLAVEAGYLGLYKKDHSGVKETLGGFDLMGKAMLPVNEQVNVFAKAGVLREKYELSSTESGVTQSANFSKYVPIIGLGAGYNVTPQVTLDAQVLHTFESSKINNGTFAGRIPAANIFLAGASYKFSTFE